MATFAHRDGRLTGEGVALDEVAARFGTPCYVYGRGAIEAQWRAFDQALAGYPHLVCYAVKANTNRAVLETLARVGAGFDIVSGGELARVLAAGADPSRVVFSGVGKSSAEMAAGLQAGIRCFNVESEGELERLDAVAESAGTRAPVAIRINPDIDAGTHPYVATGLTASKFGVPVAAAEALYRRAADMGHVDPLGVDCHIGSQLTDLGPVLEAADCMLTLVTRLRTAGLDIRHIDMGGGLGVRYGDEEPPSPQAYGQALRERLAGCGCELIVEPGRAIMAEAGVLLTRVEYIKAGADRDFVVVDAAMNDLLRPALYDAWQGIEPVIQQRDRQPRRCDVVGPVCETGDFLGRARELAVAPGDLLAVTGAGAYGFAMASNYNSRPRPAEVMVDTGRAYAVRDRETLEDLTRGEHGLPDTASDAGAGGPRAR